MTSKSNWPPALKLVTPSACPRFRECQADLVPSLGAGNSSTRLSQSAPTRIGRRSRPNSNKRSITRSRQANSGRPTGPITNSRGADAVSALVHLRRASGKLTTRISVQQSEPSKEAQVSSSRSLRLDVLSASANAPRLFSPPPAEGSSPPLQLRMASHRVSRTSKTGERNARGGSIRRREASRLRTVQTARRG